MAKTTTRRLTLSRQYRELKTYFFEPASARIVPRLHLSGVWLEQAGFAPGDQVTITVRKNRLVIKKLPANGDR